MLRILGVKMEGYDSGTMEVIYNLSNGSAGVALEMLSEDILECLEDIVALLLSPRPLNHLKIETIFDNWARSAPRTEPNWLEQKLLIVIFWMSQGIRRVAQDPSGGRENLSNENSLLKILVGLYGLSGMCEKLTKAEELIVRSKRLNLDRKETFFSFVGMLND